MRKVFLSLGSVALLTAAALLLVKADEPNNKTDPKTVQEKLAASRIVKVTVYPSNALVTREVSIPEGEGPVEVVVPNLPPQTVDSSLYSEGTDGLRVLSTRYRTRPVKEDTREEVRKAEDELKKLALAQEKLKGEIKSIDENLKMIGKLENFTSVTTVHSTEKATLNSENVIALAKYVMEQRVEKGKELVAIQQQLQHNQEQIDFLKRQMKELTPATVKTERDAIIFVDRQKGAAGKVRLNYLVESVSWKPMYKFRAGKGKEAVQVEYLAALMQQTGENWSGVDLTLSTAQPMLNAAPPELKTLEVTVMDRSGVPMPGGGKPGADMTFVPQSPPAELEKNINSLRQKAVDNYNAKQFEAGVKLWNEAAAQEQNRELMRTKEELIALQRKGGMSSDEGPSVTYHLKNRLTIPSRNDEQVVEVAKITMSPEFYYKAVPVLNKHVYRLATLTNKSQMILLPGEATMYQGTDFVGRMTLPLVAIGEQFTAGFGVDPQLQIQRQMMDKSRSTKGANQVLNYEYRILVSSYKSEPVQVQVWDRLPHGEVERVGVSLVKSTPEVSKDALYLRENRPNNLLRWDVEVSPTMNGEKALAISYEFKMELGQQNVISSFLTK
jgi:hypothetical protein